MAKDNINDNPNERLKETEKKQEHEGKIEKENTKESSKEIKDENEDIEIKDLNEKSNDDVSQEEVGDQEEENISEVQETPREKEKIEHKGKNYWAIGGILVFLIILFSILGLILRKNKKKEKRQMNIEKSDYSTAKQMESSKKCPVTVVSIHDIGNRNSQQDSFGLSDLTEENIDKKGVLAVVADGMGGLSDGDKVSQIVVITMLKGFDDSIYSKPPASLLLKLVHDANEEVCNYLGSEKIGKCGSTLVAAIVKDMKLSWISVGDSHIYVFRNDKLVKLNIDHNYAVELDGMVKNGDISLEDALRDPQREALTSYIGKGELELVDQNESAIILESKDRILLMSDGIFGTINENRITEIMKLPLMKACRQLEYEVKLANKTNQDNYTCVVMEVK